MGRILGATILLTGLLLSGYTTEYVRAKRKMDSIATDQIRRGATVSFSPVEVNAFAKGELAASELQGIRDPVIHLGQGTATGLATVELTKLFTMPENSYTKWLLSSLLEGERPLSVRVRVDSKGGLATVIIERIELSGMALEGSALDFVLDKLFRPRFPDAKIGEPFELSHNVDAIQVRPQGIDVKIRR